MANHAATVENLGRYHLSTGQNQPLKIQVSNLDNAYYQLADAETGLAPEQAAFTRVNDDLHISFEEAGAGQTDLIIENYYAPSQPTANPLWSACSKTAHWPLILKHLPQILCWPSK